MGDNVTRHSRPRSAPSSPLWRKRPSTAPLPMPSASHENKITFPQTGPSYLYDKALPPLPDAAGSASLCSRRLPATPTSMGSNASPTLIAGSAHNTTNPSTSALVQTTLGLTPAIPTTPLLEANTITHDTHSHGFTSPILRKAKSSQKLKTDMTDVISEHTSNMDTFKAGGRHHRIRGFSFSSSNLFSFAGDLMTKGKEKEVDASKTCPRPLTRKGSFWSRRRHVEHSSGAQVPSSASVTPIATSSTEQVSPSTSSKNQARLHVRGLSRSLSERSFLSRSSPSIRENRIFNLSFSPYDRSSSIKVPQSPHWSGFLHSRARNSRDLIDFPRVSRSDEPHPTLRPRAQTNPPLLHRLSLNIFSFATSPSSPNPQNLSAVDLTVSPSATKTETRFSRSAGDGETPAAYVRRLISSINKAEVAGILASSAELFYTQSLQIYIDRFDFLNDPLDIAMRKLLMHVGLPRETQQIDRVIEAFAHRYQHCNPGLFMSEDHPYILAFSMIMLHTDAFNKSNKKKMTKADYVKNTKLPGVAPEVLECFYDNIVFAPFIFIEEPLETFGQTVTMLDTPTSRMFPSISTPSLGSNGNAGALLKSNKIDPYYLIVHNFLSPLRVDVRNYIPPESPYSYEGTAGPWDIDKLQHEFASAGVLFVDRLDQWQDSYTTTYHPEVDAAGCFSHVLSSAATTCALKIVKTGLLSKKDDVLVGGKKATNRKWRSWVAVLTASHLLLFRDLSFIDTLRSYLKSSHEHAKVPQFVAFKPDESLAIQDSIAVYDQSYIKYDNTIRFAMSDGHQILLQAPNEKDLNDWIARINYMSTFKTAQIRISPPSMTRKMVELTGVAAATSHLQDVQQRRRSIQIHHWDSHSLSETSSTLTNDPNSNSRTGPKGPPLAHDDKDIPISPEVDGSEQFKATFDQVKANLATGCHALREKLHGGDNSSFATLPAESENSGFGQLHLRAHAMQLKVEQLQESIAIAQSQIESDMQLVRNVALLTPFRKSSRDSLHTALQVIGTRVAQLRINLVKLLCYHDTLCRDRSSEARLWEEAKRLATQTAELTLHNHYEGMQSHSVWPVNSSNFDGMKRSRSESVTSGGHSSSASESFYSAIDPGPDWFSLGSPTSGNSSSPNDRINLVPDVREVPNSTTSSVRLSSSDASHDHSRVDDSLHNNLVREEAEIWDKTRCAQRVSLVRLPSKLLMTRRPSVPGT
ncbi:hypothetical protein AX15_001171 [Amanita polypyramis BW_CC]|nr:hypothetical protein AX15_001171 [Amanita polypyramis BW_CC]